MFPKMYKISLPYLSFLKQKRNTIFYRRFSVASERKRVCIVGSGPAGFYSAQQLLKNHLIDIDIFEKLPAPFGLIRYGVAPDHTKIKNVMNIYTKIASNERCKFYGNVNVGEDVSISELLDSYHAVVLAYGATCDKVMGIPGEDSKNVIPARRLVGWYNGHPDFINEKVDLDTEVATIVGHGNVAVDVARILLKNLDELKSTEISEHAYEALKKSKIQKVILLGRRGPLQSTFTIKEVRELTKLTGCSVEINDNIVKLIASECKELERPKKRMMELLNEVYDQKHSTDKATNEKSRCLEIKFLRSPKEIISDTNSRVRKLVTTINKVKDPCDRKSTIEFTEEEDVIDCGLVIRSIGYQSIPIESSLPFDNESHVISNINGRVKDRKGLYCSGWVKSGPIGVLVSTMHESYETIDTLLDDLEKGEITQNLPQDKNYILKLLKEKGVRIVTFEDWKKIDKFELEKGQKMGKAREKIYKVEDMLRVLESS